MLRNVHALHTQIFVFYPEEDKVGVKTIKTFAERMRNEGVARAVMVTQANMTPFARQCLAEMAPKYYIEVVRLPLLFSHCRTTRMWRIVLPPALDRPGCSKGNG